MSDLVVKTSRKGYKAITADPQFLTIDSTKNQLKRYMEDSGTLTFPATSANQGVRRGVSLSHGLGYKPFFFAYVKGPGDSKFLTVPATLGVSDNTGDTALIYCGRSNGIYESFLSIYTIPLQNDAFSAKDIEYKCLIYVDPEKDAWS
jgi:hypothetical protein